MDGEKGVAIQVGKDIVQPIVDAKIQAAVIAALDCEHEMVGLAVAKVLQQKVERNGEIPRYGDSNCIPYVQFLFESTLKKAAGAAVASWVKDNEQKIRDSLVKQLPRQLDAIAKSFCESLVKAASNEWHFHIELTDSREKPKH